MNTEWNLKLLLTSEDSNTIQNIKEEVRTKWDEFTKKWGNNKNYLEDPIVLKQALDEYEALHANYGMDKGLSYYFELKDSLDQGNSNTKTQINKIDDFISKLSNQIQFFTHRISKVDEAKQHVLLNAAELQDYRHFLERLFQESKHLLTEDQEKIITLISKPATYNWRQMVEAFVANDEEEVLTEEGKLEKRPMSQIGPMIDTRNIEVRESAVNALYKIRERWSNVSENEINSLLEYKKNIDLLRNFERPDSGRHLADDIDTEVVDAMIESVVSKFSIIEEYFKFKAKLIKKDVLQAHEALLGIEYLDESIDVSNIKKYSFEEAVELVSKVMGNLDSEFKQIFEDFFNEGRVDVYPQKGKVNGAFCASVHKTQPVYILLNFTGKLQDCLTMAHEMGHGINDILMRKQNELNYGTVLSTAEVASTFMEDFVWQEIVKEANDEQKFVLIMQKIDDDIGTIFMQVACYTFEQNLHKQFREKGYLSKAEISEIFLNSFSNLFGRAVEYSKTKYKWVTWTHIRTFFYVYSYASGLLISKSLQNSVKNNPKFISKVKEFLSAGTSKSPKDTFMDLGIDITQKEFWINGLKEVEDLINTAKELAIKLGKI